MKTKILGIIFICFFGFLMFHQLSARPMHNDEGVNTWFLEKLIEHNDYKYDPKNYHGPSLYYIQLVFTWINGFVYSPATFKFNSDVGITATSVRTGTVVCGLFLLLGLLSAARRLGSWGALTAVILMGSSCGFIFYSRYFIHETFFAFFTLGIYLSAVYFRDTRRPLYFYTGCASTVLLYATKETSVLILFVLLLSALLTGRFTFFRQNARTLVSELKFHLVGGIGLGLLIWMLLYSSFFTNFNGLKDSLITYLTWTKTGVESGHNKPFLYFLRVLLDYERPLLFMSSVGGVVALITRKKSGLFLLFWTVGIFLVHSLIPYKTPWLIISILLPMALLAGFGVGELYEKMQENRKAGRYLAVALLAGGLLVIESFPKTMLVVFAENDNEHHPYVYTHTSRDIYRLVRDIDALAKRSNLNTLMPINIVSTVEWPLPFYFKKYPYAYFWRRIDNIPKLATPLIIAEASQRDGLGEKLKPGAYIVRPYLLRPGVPIELWVQRDLMIYE